MIPIRKIEPGSKWRLIDNSLMRVTVGEYLFNTGEVTFYYDGGSTYKTTREDFLAQFIEENKMNDPVNHPSHYTKGKIEVIDFIEDQKLNYHLSSVIKYVCRSPHKGNQIEDLMKARWYLDREISNLQDQVVPDWDNSTTKQGELK